jgi:hypothetical protein
MEIYRKNKDLRERFEIVAFSLGVKTFKDLDSQTKQYVDGIWKGPLPFPVAIDSSGDTQRKWGIASFPNILLVDPSGTLVRGGNIEMFERELEKMRG